MFTPPSDEGFFAAIGRRNVSAFYKNKVEVGRIYYFREKSKRPLIIKEPEIGIYRNGNQTLRYLGTGR